jgi:hypothetical protein
MTPRAHLRINESAARAQTGNVNVMIDQPGGINVVESAFDKVGGFVAEFVVQLLRLSGESPADGMDETHV